MKNIIVAGLLALISMNASAQQASSVTTQIELGAIFTTGNTENENIKYKVTVDWDKQDWDYKFTSDGFRSSQDGIANAQRLYHTANANYTINSDSYAEGRVTYENDKFSGFESQSDVTFSYGRNLLQSRQNMTLGLVAGVGYRRSETIVETTDEAILRLAANYNWNLSETAAFVQDFSVHTGSVSDIYRSETSIQSDILANLSLKFAVKIRHQNVVPVGREETDTETSVTLVLKF